METTHTIADAVGRSKMSEALNVGATAVSKAVVSGKFPPSWFLVMQSLCRDIGIDCPPSLFGMKSTIGETGGAESKGFQGQHAEKVDGADR